MGTKAADLFPANSLGTLMGLVEIERGVGIAVGPVLGGLPFDLRGDYQSTFTHASILFLASMCTMWLIKLKRPDVNIVEAWANSKSTSTRHY